ncbi:MAG: peptidoglycan-binding protein [Pegethrix bostrychoides GSE-TBD4-15B]|jgi:hypothetical protein|uniref:Peptidoglycan-binding protein n=1 Tax=Pegethrix bostrychoides GSE-TBD4-15B TaxID=2839662 RepID=A0A951U4I5_9CYAN|nr:peptidoglycan-binding protein [Pegethrix bostrychoides GSE-TBD4-15B]
METVAYTEVAQGYEDFELSSEGKSFANIKVSGKAVAAAIGVSATALAGGLLSAAPAMAYGYGCCRPTYRPIHRPIYRPISYSGCYSSCYSRPVYYSYQSYQPTYYSSSSSYDCYCDSGSSGSSGGDYQGISYHPVTDANLLKLGASGEIVALLQQTLADLGYPVSVDGLYGYETKEAVIAYQVDQGLLVDGIAGGQTLDSLGLAGAGA